MTTNDDELRKQARERIEQRRALGANCVSFVVVSAVLVAIWAISDGGYFWPAWIMLFWGVGLALHAWSVFFRRPITEADIDREIQRFQGKS